MTLAISLISNEGIALVSDSRATVGDPRGLTTSNDTVQKIFQLSKNIGLAVAGAGDIGATIVDNIEKKISDTQDINTATKNICKALKENFRQWFPKPVATEKGYVRDWPPLLFIVCGYSIDNKPYSYILASANYFAPQKSTMGFHTIGVIPLAVYLLNRLYKKDSPLQTTIELGAYCILETASQDGKVGGPLQAAIIEPSKGFKFLTNEKINNIISKVKQHRKNLQDSFYKLNQEIK